MIFCFQVISTDKSFTVIADTLQNKNRWISDLHKHVRTIHASVIAPSMSPSSLSSPLFVWQILRFD